MEEEHQDLTTRLNETTSGSTTVNIQEVSAAWIIFYIFCDVIIDFADFFPTLIRLIHYEIKSSHSRASNSIIRKFTGPHHWSSVKWFIYCLVIVLIESETAIIAFQVCMLKTKMNTWTSVWMKVIFCGKIKFMNKILANWIRK